MAKIDFPSWAGDNSIHMTSFPREAFPIPSKAQIESVNELMEGIRDLQEDERKDLALFTLVPFISLIDMLMYQRASTEDKGIQKALSKVIAMLQKTEETYREVIGPLYLDDAKNQNP